MQKTYNRLYAPAIAGMLKGINSAPKVLSPTNTADSLDDVWTLAIPAAPTSSAVYSVIVDGVSASATTDATATQAELEQLLLDAIRNSGVYDLVVPILDAAAHTIKLSRRVQGVVMAVTVSGTGLTATHTTTAALAGEIPFGRIVGRQAADAPGTVRLMKTLSDVPKGVALAVRAAIEKQGIHQGAYVAYQPDEAIDMLTKSLTNDVCVECVEETGIGEDSAVYVSVAAGHEGKVTGNNTGTIALPGVSFTCPPFKGPNGENLIYIDVDHFN